MQGGQQDHVGENCRSMYGMDCHEMCSTTSKQKEGIIFDGEKVDHHQDVNQLLA